MPEPRIEAVRPFLNRQVEAVVDLQLLTGARPGEILSMRPCDIETGGGVWRYRPSDHKILVRYDLRDGVDLAVAYVTDEGLMP